MEFPQLVMQPVLWLVGWAMSRYLWDVNSADTLAILRVVRFIIVFCFFVAMAWATPANRLDQTPASTIIRSAVLAISSPFRI